MLDYDRAVEICAKHYSAVFRGAGRNKTTPFSGPMFNDPLFVGPDAPPSSSQVRRAPSAWVEIASEDIEAHEALLLAARNMRQNGEELPRPIEEWLISLALGEITPPEGPRHKDKNTVDGLIYHSVAALVIQFKLKPMQNLDLDLGSALPENRSACAIVAEAFARIKTSGQKLQVPASYQSVRTRWQVLKKLSPFDPDQYKRDTAENRSGIWQALEAASK